MAEPPEAFSMEVFFRYQVIAQVMTRELCGTGRQEAVSEVASACHLDFKGKARRVSVRTLYRWLRAYEDSGLQALERKLRRVEKGSVLPGLLVEFAVLQKTDDPQVSVPELLRQAKQMGIVKPGQRVDRTTLYRELKRRGLPVARRKQGRDTRRFAWLHRMQMVLCDGKHFRAGVSRLKRVALFFLDDATRYGLHVVVGPSETQRLFLRGLFGTYLDYGSMQSLYLDKGPGFNGGDTAQVAARLDLPLIFGETRYPQGHGKIERFNQTAKQRVIRFLDGRPDVDPDCRALELRLSRFLDDYNNTPHESLGMETPRDRFFRDDRDLEFPASEEALRRKFTLSLSRRVSNDHVVKVKSVDYEMPRGCAGARVMLYRRLIEGTVWTLHEGRMIQLLPVDLHKNAKTRRGRRDKPDQTRPLTRGAADMAFDTDYGPVVDADGGYVDDSDESKKEE